MQDIKEFATDLRRSLGGAFVDDMSNYVNDVLEYGGHAYPRTDNDHDMGQALIALAQIMTYVRVKLIRFDRMTEKFSHDDHYENILECINLLKKLSSEYERESQKDN